MTNSGWVYGDDNPADPAAFDFDLVAHALSGLLLTPSRGAIVIGLHGPWGCGKTTLMQAVRDNIVSRTIMPPPIIVEFNAWKFHERDALWRALILRLVAELRNQVGDDPLLSKELDELESSLYQAFAAKDVGPWSVNWRSLVTELASIALAVLHLDIVAQAVRRGGGWFGRLFGGAKNDGEQGLVSRTDIEQLGKVLERTTVERQVNRVQSIEQFLDRFRRIIERLRAGDRSVFVFIDDLDRCLPEASLEVFEAVKLFLDAPGCGFVVALDRDVIRRGLAVRYAHASGDGNAIVVDADEYIEKTISISYDVPQLSAIDLRSLIDVVPIPIALSEAHTALILRGLGPNPRRIKRFMNLFALQLELASILRERGRVVPSCLAPGGDGDVLAIFLKLLIVSYHHSGVFRAALEDDTLLPRLQGVANATKDSAGNAGPERAKKLSSERAAVQSLVHRPGFWGLMELGPDLTVERTRVVELTSWFRAGASSAT